MSQPVVASGVATAAGPVSVPGLVGSAADLKQAASGRQLGSDTKPQERAAETTSPEAAITPAAPATPVAPVASTPPAEKPKFSDEVSEAAKAFGVDISGFADDANAQYAIDQAIEQTRRIGARPLQQPQAEVPTEDEEEEDFDFSTIQDAKVAAHVRKLQEQANGAVQFVKQLEQQQIAERQAVAKRMYDDLVGRAKKKIDSLESPDFGVGDQINYPQQLQRKNLMDAAADIIAGARANGREIEVEAAINAAMTVLGKKPGAPAAPAPKSLQPGSLGPGGKTVAVQPFFGKVRPAWDLTGVTSDPNMQRGLTEILHR
jgi:hypothetical protein